jgi:mono/diheme cytochrome c family protein
MPRGHAVLWAAALCACHSYPQYHEFREPMKLGGETIPAATLQHGQRAYMLYCRACHGEKGDGKGPSAPALRPPPRDFTLGAFKFGAVPAGTLPHDEDFVRIVRFGLHGTAMLSWDGVPDAELQPIIQYLKTFSARWKDETPGDAIVPTPDPWAGKVEEGVIRGKKVYHGLAQCLSCHPSYASKAFIYEASKELTGNAIAEFRKDMYGAELKESDYGVKLLPPDFTRSDLRSVRPGRETEDIYRVIAAGVGGTAMPTWRGSLPEEDLWALTHFVQSLLAMKGKPEAAATIRRAMEEDAHFTPPTTPAAQ